MRIAQVAPLFESVPPFHYGGTERMVSWLTEELVQQGNDVTLFASGDSRTSARLRSCCQRSLRSDSSCKDALAHHVAMVEKVTQSAKEFDIVHFHIDYLHFPTSRAHEFNQISTLHGRLDLPDLIPIYEEFSEMPVVSISHAQRAPLPGINWIGNVYHGAPANLFSFQRNRGNYLAFLGRVSPEKRLDRAIEIAIRAGVPLKVAAKIDRADTDYFNNEIKSLLSHPLIQFIGEIGDSEKNAFLGNASACLMPIDWPEPFGINMIESMACGTPVIAYRHGSVPEIITTGVNGFVVETIDEAVEAVHRVPGLSRVSCRDSFEQRFTAARMASDYLRLYEATLSSQTPEEIFMPTHTEQEDLPSIS